MNAQSLQSSQVDPEERARLLLSDYLHRIRQPNVDANIEHLMSQSGFRERFEFFVPKIDESAKESLLISGCAVGSEHLVAREFGFQKIFGVEVTSDYVSIARERLSDVKDTQVDFYDGRHLPYADNFFSMIYSGHVIEHTPKPYEYFREHLRVLKPGGFFFLEFPNRYHWKELHTGLPSVEWMPKTLRRLVLKALRSPRSPLAEKTKLYLNDIEKTLQPISIWQVRLYLAGSGLSSSKLVSIEKPLPGFVRILMKK